MQNRSKGLASLSIIFVLTAAAPAVAPKGIYTLDGKHTSVMAKVSHLGLSEFTMRFRPADAHYDYDPAKPASGSVTVAIDPRSVDTGVAALDAELAGERFFDTARFPQATFVSTRIVPGSGGRGEVSGTLTMHGVAHAVTLDVLYRGTAKQGGADKMGFSATTVIKRSDFGMTTLVGPVGDDVKVQIEAEFVRKP